MKKITLCILCLFSNVFAQFSGPIFGGDFDHNPHYRRQSTPVMEPVSKCEVLRNEKSFLLNKTDYSLDELFLLISTIEYGSEIIAKVKSLIARDKLIIRNLSSFVRQSRGLSHKTSALYDFTASTPTIYISYGDEIGLAAHFFVHEAVHALDELIPVEYEVDMVYYRTFKEFQKLFRLDIDPMKELSEYESKIMSEVWDVKEAYRDRHAYRAERYAFDKQGDFTKKILEPRDCYRSYVEEHRKLNGLKLYSETPDQHIFDSYGIDKNNIDEN